MSYQGIFHFEMSERKLLLRLFDVLIIGGVVVGLNYLFDKTYIYWSNHFWLWLTIYCVYYLIFGTIFELYVLKQAESRFKVVKNLSLTILVSTLLYLFTPYITPILPPNRILIFHLLIGNMIFLTLWRFSYITFINAPRFYKKVLFVGDNFDIDKIYKELYSFDPNYKIFGYIDSGNNKSTSKSIPNFKINKIAEIVKHENINEIVVSDSFRGVNEVVFRHLIPLLKKGTPIKPYSKVYEDITKRILLQDVSNDFYYYFPFSRSNQNKLYLTLNRLLDIIISIIGIVLILFIIPLILLINLFYNPGKLFYQQVRIGKFSQPFKILKFRTMVKNAEDKGAQWARKDDLRVTPFGKFLRKTRIDEFPQFFNILKNDMSLIGPRPERPEFIQSLKKEMLFYETRHVIKPGLTGWAQVNAKYASSNKGSYEKLQYDLYYIKNRSLFLDFRIMVKSISTIIFFKGH